MIKHVIVHAFYQVDHKMFCFKYPKTCLELLIALTCVACNPDSNTPQPQSDQSPDAINLQPPAETPTPSAQNTPETAQAQTPPQDTAQAPAPQPEDTNTPQNQATAQTNEPEPQPQIADAQQTENTTNEAAESPEPQPQPQIADAQQTENTTNEAAESPEPSNKPATAQTITNDTTPLSAELRAKLKSIPWDTPPEVLNAVEKANEGGHFPWSDELHPEMFYDSIHNLGGTYLGVGTDQAYVFIGWQRPTLAFAVDYDPWVVYIHHGYMALFDTCENIECFKQTLENKDDFYNFITNYYNDHPDKKMIGKICRTVRGNILRQLTKIKKYPHPTFVNDPETYQYIRTLIQSGRLVTLQANLLGDTALKAISQTLRDTDRTLTTLYTSNAEQYWSYTKAFKENIRAIPFSNNALIMRTVATKPRNNDYRYSVMPSDVFLAWLNHPNGTAVKRIIKKYKIESETHIPFLVDDDYPPQTP